MKSKIAKAIVMCYAPVQNVCLIACLIFHNQQETYTTFQHLLSVEIDSIATWFVAAYFGMCKKYQIAVLNPPLWHIILYYTPISWNAWIVPVAITITVGIIGVLLQAWVKNICEIVI